MLKKLFNETMQEMLEVEMDMILERCAGNGVPTLYQYYLANKPENSDWVVLPVTNFDAYLGTTIFSRNWLAKLPESIL